MSKSNYIIVGGAALVWLAGSIIGETTDLNFLAEASPIIALIIVGGLFGLKGLDFLRSVIEPLINLTKISLVKQTEAMEKMSIAIVGLKETQERLINLEDKNTEALRKLEQGIEESNKATKETLHIIQNELVPYIRKEIQ